MALAATVKRLKNRRCNWESPASYRHRSMNETLNKFRQAVSERSDLQERVKAGADLVVLGKENGYNFTADEVEDFLREVRIVHDCTKEEQLMWLERIG